SCNPVGRCATTRSSPRPTSTGSRWCLRGSEPLGTEKGRKTGDGCVTHRSSIIRLPSSVPTTQLSAFPQARDHELHPRLPPLVLRRRHRGGHHLPPVPHHALARDRDVGHERVHR